jgi:hypothetical protein
MTASLSEMFPTRVRCTGISISYQVTSISSVALMAAKETRGIDYTTIDDRSSRIDSISPAATLGPRPGVKEREML